MAHWLNSHSAIADWIIAIMTTVIAGGVVIGWRQLRQDLEERYNEEYRRLLKKLPLKAILGRDAIADDDGLRAFYIYFDVSDEQLVLCSRFQKISGRTSDEWKAGIEYNMSLPAFKNAWNQIRCECNNSGVAPLPFESLKIFLKKEKKLNEMGMFVVTPPEYNGVEIIVELP